MRVIILSLLFMYPALAMAQEQLASGNQDSIATPAISASADVTAPVPVITHHIMKKIGTKFAPTMTFQVADCEGCYVVYDETLVSEAGQTQHFKGIRGKFLSAWGVVQDRTLTADVVAVAENVRGICYHHIKVCRRFDPSTCVSLDPGLYYEWDTTSGTVNETLPQKPEGLIKNSINSICSTPVS